MSDTLSEMNLDVLHQYLSSAYWSEGIPFNVMKKAFENSLCFGVFSESNSQVGFARVITDKATFAYIADVFVLEEHRGKGLSKWLMEFIISHKELQGLRRMVLATKDAHSLYEKFGFNALVNPQVFMELWDPCIYKNA